METRTCVTAWLVSLDFELPTDESIAYDGTPPITGCNRLLCTHCGSRVRHVDNRTLRTNLVDASEAAELYDSANPESSPLMDAGWMAKGGRTYFCRCDAASVGDGGAKRVDTLDKGWRCGGHPVRSAPA